MVSMMDGHMTEVTWTYVVPPHNDVLVVITQRKDGPFSTDEIGGRGHYCVSVAELVRGACRHVEGSTQGGVRSFEAAFERAEQLWEGNKR